MNWFGWITTDSLKRKWIYLFPSSADKMGMHNFVICVFVSRLLLVSSIFWTKISQRNDERIIQNNFKWFSLFFRLILLGFMWFMIKVTFGEHDRCDDKTRPETRFVLRAISQPFSFSNFDNDVALLRLNDRVPITDFIRPICLPTTKCTFTLFLTK